MSSQLRQIQILAIILSSWLLPGQVYSYRGVSASSDGNANAAWRVEADSSDYDYRQQNPRQRLANRRQMLEDGIRKHRRGVESAVNGARNDPQKLLRPPPIELDPVQGLISDLRNNKPVIIGFDQGDRALAADLNILPQSMAPRTPGTVDEKIQITDPTAKTAVLVILPSKLANPSSILTKIAVEAASKAECLIFQPNSCEFDPLSPNPELTIPADAIPFEIPGPGKHEIELPEGLEVNPALPVMIVQSILASDESLALMQKVEDVQRAFIHRGPVRDARDLVADVYYSNYKIGTDNYFQQLPLIKQHQQIVPSMHMTHRYLEFTGSMMHLVEDFGEEHFAVWNGENLAHRNRRIVEGRRGIVNQNVEHYSERIQAGNYEIGLAGH